MKRRSFQVEAGEVGQPLWTVLAQRLGMNEADARALIERGAVYRRGRRFKEAAWPAEVGEPIVAVLEEAGVLALSAAPPAERLQVLFEDAELIAVLKPPGLTAQPTPMREGDSLLDLVTAHLQHPAGLVHRLDKETSGVTVFGKTKQATGALAEAFRLGRAHKRYLAVTGPGLPERGHIDLPLSPDPSRPGRYRATRAANGASAQTDYERLHGSEAFCLVALFPRTGRTHQLRAHLAALDAPILGDRRYGGASAAAGIAAPRCLLHAQGLSLPHPRTGRTLLLEAPVPQDLAAFFQSAKVTPPSGPW